MENQTKSRRHTSKPWIETNDAIVSANEKTGHDDPQTIEFYGGHLICESVPAHNRPLITEAPEMYCLLNMLTCTEQDDGFAALKAWAGCILERIKAKEDMVGFTEKRSKHERDGRQAEMSKEIDLKIEAKKKFNSSLKEASEKLDPEAVKSMLSEAAEAIRKRI